MSVQWTTKMKVKLRSPSSTNSETASEKEEVTRSITWVAALLYVFSLYFFVNSIPNYVELD